MSNKLVFFSFIITLIFVSYIGFSAYKKYYLKYNKLRLDPLEEQAINPKILISRNDSLDIWLVGNSRVAHWNTKHFQSIPGNIVNLGVDGQTTRQILERLKNHLEKGSPDWILLEAGINDLKVIGLQKKKPEKILMDCYNNIISIFTLCKEKNIKLIYCNIFPTGNIELLRRLVWNNLIDNQIIELNKKIQDYCYKNNIEYFDAYDILAEGDKVKQEFQNGFLHLNNNGYSVLTNHFISQFGRKILNDDPTNLYGTQ